MTVINSMVCNCCGKTKRLSDFYMSLSIFDKNTKKTKVCKQCIWEYVENDNGDLKIVKDTLRMLDKPFLQELWKSSVEESERTKKDSFKIYMKNVAMGQYKELNWDDSIFITQTTVKSLSGDVEENTEMGEIISYWGKGYSDLDYEFLENEKLKLTASFECPDYGMEMLMKDICFINLDIEKIRQEKRSNSHKEVMSLIETRGKLMTDANMKPVQATGAEANDQVTFGTLIKKWENEKPIPKRIDDDMKEYIDTFMVGHLAKMEGLHNELTDKYDKALSKYTIEFSEINKEKDEEFEE